MRGRPDDAIDDVSGEFLSPWAALGVTLVAGAVGLLTDRVTRSFGWSFPSTGYLIGELIWKIATFGLLVWGIRHFTHERVTASTLGFDSTRKARQRYPTGLAVGVAAGAIALSALVGASATSASSYGQVHSAGWALAVGELVIRYPLTVVAEEAMFRGWMQPRLGRNGPVLSAVLWSTYHLQQASTIPSLVVFGLGLGFLRWWNDNVRAAGAVHYVSDSLFFIATYL